MTYLNNYGNADSRTHYFGVQSKKVIENARQQIAELLEVNSTEVFFNSGATESNNIAILGLREYAEKIGKKHIITKFKLVTMFIMWFCKDTKKGSPKTTFIY